MKNKLNVRFWKIDKKFKFPETNSEDPLHYEPIIGRPSSGICISGGGTVSASLIAGYFKALDELNIMDSLQYISGVSGGCWGSTPFAYMQGLNDSAFYAAVKAPEEYYLDKKKAKNGETTDVHVNPENSMTSAVSNAPIVKLTLAGTAHKHEAYARAVGTIFLHPFNISSPEKDFETRRYFTSDANALNDIISRNTQLEKTEDKILQLAKNRPYLIMNTTFLLPDGKDEYTRYLFEFTPNYAGMFAQHGTTSSGIELGGSYVETIGFNTEPTKLQENTINTESDYKFELCEPVGTSGSAIEEMVLKDNLTNPLKEWLPQYNYWNPIQYQSDSSHPKVDKFFFGDGGIIENTGVISLLLRKVENVAIFLSEPVFFADDYPANKKIKIKKGNEYLFGYNQIACLFGEKLLKMENEANQFDSPIQALTYIDDSIDRQVFDNSKNEFQKLLDAIHTAKANGGPIVHRQSLKVKDNTLFGVKGGWTCNVIWSIIDTCSAFNEKLDSDISSKIGASGDLEDFPKVKVFFENGLHLIQLKPIQANLLGSLAYWMVTSESDTYISTLTQREL